MGPMPMNLRIKGRSNDRINKHDGNGDDNVESVNMAIIIGKDKRSKFGDDS